MKSRTVVDMIDIMHREQKTRRAEMKRLAISALILSSVISVLVFAIMVLWANALPGN